MVTRSPYCHLRRCALFVLGPICAEVAGHVAMRSLPCHMGSSYLARLTGNRTQDLSKRGAQPPRVHITRTAKNSWKNIDKFIGSALDMSVLSQLRKG